MELGGCVMMSSDGLPPERRQRVDRRRRPAWASRYFWFGGRRQGSRREEDGRGGYADVYDWRIGAAVLGLLVLGVCDATFTLMLIARGAEEINPVMAAALNISDVHFLGTKLALTLPGVVVLAVHQHFPLLGRLKVRDAAGLLLGAYGLLVSYQLVLLQRVV